MGHSSLFRVLPVSAVVPTRNRHEALERTLISLRASGALPRELIVVDASDSGVTRDLISRFGEKLEGEVAVRWTKALAIGAAGQRKQAMQQVSEPYIWFFDDDVIFEVDCLARLHACLESNPRIGGANAMITNQKYHPPGFGSRLLFRVLNGRSLPSYAGRVLGPAVHLLPEDREDLPDQVPVEWMNTTCTLYRRCALPSPPFDVVFTGYSIMEDLALSLRVGRAWRLVNVRGARIFHDSQSGEHKSDARALSAMELANRHYVMTEVLGRRALSDYAKLLLWEFFQVGSCFADRSARKALWPLILGKWDAIETSLARRRGSPK